MQVMPIAAGDEGIIQEGAARMQAVGMGLVARSVAGLALSSPLLTLTI